jgi:predicted nucleic acid-binding protein
VGGSVKVNFPPDLERVKARLAMGPVKHEVKELRDPDKNKLLALQFDYITETRGNVLVTPDHDNATIAFRIMNATGFEIVNTTYPAAMVKNELLDELAKMMVAQPHRFA